MDLLALWGKTGKEGTYHPLLYHMLDVAHVAALLWKYCLPNILLKRLAATCQISEALAEALTIVLTGLHDIGKASPVFQVKCPELAEKLPTVLANDCIVTGRISSAPHGWVSAKVLKRFLTDAMSGLKLDQINAGILASMAAAHHGTFPSHIDVKNLGPIACGTDAWDAIRLRIIKEFLIQTCLTEDFVASSGIDLANPFLLPFITGLISVADWIGSSDYFPPVGQRKIADYLPLSQERAYTALTEFGWMPPPSPPPPADFRQIFGFDPRTMQSVVAETIASASAPYLLIVEAPMGLGKTEAALYAIDHNTTRQINNGFYIALPTQATSNAMYGRVRNDYLAARGFGGTLNLQLTHGHAAMVLEDESYTMTTDNVEQHTTCITARQWFMGKKRPLLAPFGVGTIDQCLMSVLQTKHWFVRLFGLAGKTVVFDEVHAYDAYMSTILERLLSWLATMGCSVIILSATLPPTRRLRLAQAYSGHEELTLAEQPYPRLSMISSTAERPIVMKIPSDDIPRHTIRLEHLPADMETLADTLRSVLRDGGCAVVICNTVNRAQTIFTHLRDNLPQTECLLFHARMPYGMRESREKEVFARFGKVGTRGGRTVLVATQVVEQSLDLDFDWMASEMAPVDLLLQRAGRLHRHAQNDANRPPLLRMPSFAVFCDNTVDNTPPDFTQSVYHRAILLASWLTIRERPTIILPDDIDALIRTVYEREGLIAPDMAWESALRESFAELSNETESSRAKAESLLIKEPMKPRFLMNKFNAQLEEDDDPNVSQSLRAATREGDPSISAVCIVLRDGAWYLHDEMETLVSPEEEPDRAMTRRLLRAAVSLSHHSVYHALKEQTVPPAWRKHPHLRHHRALLFEDGVAIVGKHTLRYDATLGIVIE